MGDEPIKFRCPHCEGVVKVPGSFAGKRGKCPKCKGMLEVPDPGAPAARDEPAKTAPRKAPTKRRPQAAPKDDDDDDDDGSASGDDRGDGHKTCRFCGEEILSTAKKCKHCGEWLDPKLRAAKRGDGGSAGPVPTALIVCGAIQMALYGLFSLFGLGLAGLSLVAGGARGLPGVVAGLMLFVVCFIVVRVGWGLTKGQRSAIYGSGVFLGLALLGSFANFAQGQAIQGLVGLVISGGLFGLPVAVGYQNWSKLK